MITLATLPNATAQEVFDQVATHLLTQNERAMSPENTCAYHAPDGKKCAAGCLISDEEYDTHFEGSNWLALLDYYPNSIPDAHAELIIDLQHIHDTLHPNHWRDGLFCLAKDKNLTFNH